MLLKKEDSLLVVIDPQGSLMHKIVNPDKTVKVINKLISIARELETPIIITEHYPEGMQPSIPEISEHLAEDYKPITKIVFSCYGEPDFVDAIKNSGRKTLVLVGIETHICVLQTALQCVEAGYQVFVVQDGISCRNLSDHEAGLKRMERNRVELITWEMVTYEWLRRADKPEFKKVLPLIKEGV